jgi:hypothetical protein
MAASGKILSKRITCPCEGGVLPPYRPARLPDATRRIWGERDIDEVDCR